MLSFAAALGKVVLFLLTWVGVWLPVMLPLASHLHWRIGQPPTDRQKLPLLGSLYLVALPVLWGATQLGDVSFADYGGVWQWDFFGSLAVGFVAAIASVFCFVALAIAFVGVQWRSEHSGTGIRLMMPLLGLGLVIAGIEEFVFRGAIFHFLLSDLGFVGAAVISSVIFAMLHLVWERAETWPQLPGLWLLGVVLVIARRLDGDRLGLAWGLHAGWIWGFALLDAAQLLNYPDPYPRWFMGQQNQPLTGGVGLSCLLGTMGALWWIWFR